MIRIFLRFKKIAFLIIPFGLLFLLVAFGDADHDSFNRLFKEYFSGHQVRLINNIVLLSKEVEKKNFNVDSARSYLKICREEYKSIEPFVIYFLPGDARQINRVIIPEIEEDDEVSAYVVPHGFQYIESMLYGDSATMLRKKIVEETDHVYSLAARLSESVSYMEIRDRDVFEALQMQLIRQFMLGLINFETPFSRSGVSESVATLKYYKEFFEKVFQVISDRSGFQDMYASIDSAVNFLQHAGNGGEQDYFRFYSEFYIPLSGQLENARSRYATDNFYNTTAINYQVRSVFDPQAFNSYFFLPAKQLSSPAEVAELGRTLFFDPALSANNLRACASCHQPGRAFTDGLPLSQSFEPGKSLSRNAPTIVNAVLQKRLFHDGRAFTFEDQAGQVMSNPLEMHNDFSQVAVKLKSSPGYREWFRTAFRNTEDTIITGKSILYAIAEYERSLTSLNSRFDRTISGRAMLMTQEEKEGFNIFMGKGECASCHFIPLFNGVMPAEYVDTEWEIIGVPSRDKLSRPQLDSDIGRAGVVNVEIFRHAFKIPTLRNIEITGPYMHNGVFRTLEEVIEFYNVGGGAGLGYDVPNQTLSPEPLKLSEDEKFKLLLFLKTLTDTANLTTPPAFLPEFSDNPLLNARPVGGDY